MSTSFIEVSQLIGKAAVLPHESAASRSFAYMDKDVYVASLQWGSMYKDAEGELYTSKTKRQTTTEDMILQLPMSQDY